jgi:phosphoribosylformylglycinamidine cyclo-ligase
VGGETAIMPDLYRKGDYDLAGFAVGIVEQARMLDGKAAVAGDVVIGIASSGIHSNGYSLVRKIVFDHAGLKAEDRVDFSEQSVGELLLTPTRLYVRPVRSVLNHYKVKSVIHGIAHITGGGLHENLARVLPPTVDAEIFRDSWPIAPVFSWMQRLGDVEEAEMFRVFNMGVGMALVVSEYYAESIVQQLASEGFESWRIGRIVDGGGEARWA